MSEWSLVYNGFDPAEEGRRETLCALGNGQFVTRAAAADSRADGVHYPGTYLAGGYNRLTSEIAGRRIENEDLVNLPNWLPLMLSIDDGGWMRACENELLEHRQELDLRAGVLTRSLRWCDVAGRVTRWQERRLVSMDDPNLAALEVHVIPENWSGTMSVRSAIDGTVTNAGVARYRDLAGRHLETPASRHLDDDLVYLHSRMVQSGREVAIAARTRFYDVEGSPLSPERRTTCEAEVVSQDCFLPARRNEPVIIEKIVALYPSNQPALSEPAVEAHHKAAGAPRFGVLRDRHARAWHHLWDECDLEIDVRGSDGGRGVVSALRLHVFHLLQTVSYHTQDLDVGVPPRGWHGEAYRGHILWDELFIFPFLTLRVPGLTRALLRYRYRRLPQARRLAREAGYGGAMFPWQSGSNGREESQQIHLNPISGRWIADDSHRQRHVGAAIAYNVWEYYQVTDDHEFMSLYGAELLCEIARFWASIARRDPADGRYHIRGVMGPDEFHTAYPGRDPVCEGGIDDNAYTNVMASWVLARALDALAALHDQRRRQLCERLELGDDELDAWDTISHTLCVPFHGDGIISQFRGYERLRELDWEHLIHRHGDVQRLDRILEAEGDTPNRYQVSKQADVLMLFYLFSAEELREIFEHLGYRFRQDMIPKNVDYYAHRTSHGSTLSWVVHSWVLARADRPRSWKMFRAALESDLADVQGGTTAEGIHLGAMAGTIDIVQRCYTGIDTRGDVLHIDPCLPAELRRLRTHVHYRRQILDIDIDHQRLEVCSRPVAAGPITLAYRGHMRRIGPGQRFRFRLVQPPEQRMSCGDPGEDS